MQQQESPQSPAKQPMSLGKKIGWGILILLTMPIAIPVIALKYFWKHSTLSKNVKLAISIGSVIVYMVIIGRFTKEEPPTAEQVAAMQQQKDEAATKVQAEKDAKATAKAEAEAKKKAEDELKNVEVGQEVYLRLPGNDDVTQLICLGETKDDYSKILRAFNANDFIGLLDIPGAFCVHNGTKVLLIEDGLLTRKVRIISGTDPIDEDKVFRSGYLASEFVVAR